MADGRKTRNTSTEYGRPYRPAVIRAVNGLGMAGRTLGLRLNLTPDFLQKTARKNMKLDDFGP
ncbi:MAG: hypothetical protein E4H36_12690, partial [Spirochaetales bacterium]